MALTASAHKREIGLTGGNGFIGSHLRKLLDQRQIAYHLFKGDLLNLYDVDAFLQNHAINTIVHLAGSFHGSFENLAGKNLIATQNLLEAGTRYGIQKIIYSSTGAVYGEPVKSKSFETDPLNPNTLYGLVKGYTEDCVRYYKNNHGIDYIILR